MLKIYITDLAAYNNGFLIGEWVSLPQEQKIIDEKIETILKKGQEVCKSSFHEEYFITDYEWEEVSLFNIEEYENISKLNEQLQQLEDIEEYQLKIIKFLFDENFANYIEEALEKVDDVIIYQDENMEDVAYNYIQECYDIDSMPSILTTHIDYKGVAEDMKINGSYYEIDGDIYEYIN